MSRVLRIQFLMVFLALTSALACSEEDRHKLQADDFDFGTKEMKISADLEGWFRRYGYIEFSNRTPFSSSGEKWLAYMYNTYGDALKPFSPDELAVLRAFTSTYSEILMSHAISPKFSETNAGAIAFNDARFAAELNLLALLEGDSQLAKELLNFSSFSKSVNVLQGPYVIPVKTFGQLKKKRYRQSTLVNRLPVVMEEKFSYETVSFGNQGILRLRFDEVSRGKIIGSKGVINLGPFSSTPDSKQIMLMSGWNFVVDPKAVQSLLIKGYRQELKSYSLGASLVSYNPPHTVSTCH